MCEVWEGRLGYVVLTFRRGSGKFWRKVCMWWWAFTIYIIHYYIHGLFSHKLHKFHNYKKYVHVILVKISKSLLICYCSSLTIYMLIFLINMHILHVVKVKLWMMNVSHSELQCQF